MPFILSISWCASWHHHKKCTFQASSNSYKLIPIFHLFTHTSHSTSPTVMAPPSAKTPIFLTQREVVLVKLINPTPLQVLCFSTIDNDPNLEILCQSIYVYRSNTSLSLNQNDPNNTQKQPPLDPAVVLKQAFSKALVYCHPLAGKLKRQPDGTLLITCNSDGVPFAEATVDISLDSLNYFDGIDPEIAQSFVFDWPSNCDFGYHPLLLQVTKFSCGGFTVGMGMSHSVCDGFGAAQFFRTIAELAKHKTCLETGKISRDC